MQEPLSKMEIRTFAIRQPCRGKDLHRGSIILTSPKIGAPLGASVGSFA